MQKMTGLVRRCVDDYDMIKEGDRVFLFSPVEYVPEVEEDFGQRHKKVRNVVIAGGDTISYYLASELEKRHVHIKIFEEDIDKCKQLADSLSDALIIHGDATDIHLLQDENIEEGGENVENTEKSGMPSKIPGIPYRPPKMVIAINTQNPDKPIEVPTILG